ncbi:MAG: TIR domain-containing protein, partial [Saprospiraceae bacterium]|nr:TIR domain-containing protein [Saprospiraceae bacterium]
MTSPIHIYLSFDPADARTAADLQRQLALALQPDPTVFWDRSVVPTEAFRAEVAKFLEKADLFVALLSMHYEDKPDVRWEANQAILTQRGRPALQILTAQARSAAIPTDLQPFQTALPSGETIENEGIARERQLLRAAATAATVLAAAPQSNDIGIGQIELPISIEDLRERLLAQTDRINHAPLLAILKRLIRDVQVKRGVLDVEDYFKQLREKTRLSQISLDELKAKAGPIQNDLYNLIERLQEEDLVQEWRQIFIRDYYRFVGDSRVDSTAPPFFVPVDDII